MTGDIGELLRAARLLPVLRGHDQHAVEAQTARCHEVGFRALEVTTTVPGGAELVTRFRRGWPDVEARALLGTTQRGDGHEDR